MKLRNSDGEVVEAETSTDYLGGCFEDLVVLVGDMPLGPAEFATYQIVEASDHEMLLLERHRFIEPSHS